jgi:nucleotide-binding universal stress UspA family protein
MATSIIVSYDGTDNDRDALSLGRVFADLGSSVALAYVRHAVDPDPRREAELQAEAQALLDEGAALLNGSAPVRTHVVVSGATGAGLMALAEQELADIVVFGSEYRTAPGHILPGTSASHLLNGGPVAVAIAPAGMHEAAEVKFATIGEISEPGDLSARETAYSLAEALGAEIAPQADFSVDLLVVGSQSLAVPGRVAISAAAQYVIENARCPVLVVPRGARVQFAESGA